MERIAENCVAIWDAISAAVSLVTSTRQDPELQVIWLVIPLKNVMQAPATFVLNTVKYALAVVVLIPVLLATFIVAVDTWPSVNVVAATVGVDQDTWTASWSIMELLRDKG